MLRFLKKRVERGYYVFAVPMGYRYEKAGSHGRLLVRNEPLASILQKGTPMDDSSFKRK